MPRAARLRPHRPRPRPAAGRRADEVAAAAVSPDVDAAIDDAIATPARVQRAADRARAADWWLRERARACIVGEKITPIAVGRAVRAQRQGQLPERRLPARRAGRRRRRAADRARRAADARRQRATSTRPCSSCAASSASPTSSASTARPASPRSASAPSRSRRCARSSAPGSPAVTCAQVEMQRYGVATMMILGPTESVVIADDTRRPDAARRRPAERGRARHRLGGAAGHHVAGARRRDRRRAGARSSPPCPTARADGGPRLARRQRRLRARRLARRGRRRRQPLRARAPAARRRRRRRGRPRSTAWSTPARSCSASTPRSPPPTSSSAARRRCPPAASPTCQSGITAEAFLKRTAIARADAAALRRMAPSILAMSRPRRASPPTPRRSVAARRSAHHSRLIVSVAGAQVSSTILPSAVGRTGFFRWSGSSG